MRAIWDWGGNMQEQKTVSEEECWSDTEVVSLDLLTQDDDEPVPDDVFEWDEDSSCDAEDIPDCPERAKQEEEVDIISVYLAEIGQIPLLTAEEEVELAKKIERGRNAAKELRTARDPQQRERLMSEINEGIAARNRLVCSNTKLVVSIARKFVGRGLPLPDLIQEGNCGLLHAVDKFDYRRGNRFATYATRWIYRAISRAVLNLSEPIRVPMYTQDIYKRVAKTYQLLTQEKGRAPTSEELSQVVQVPVRQIERLFAISQPTLSLDSPIQEGSKETVSDLVPDPSPTPTEKVETSALNEALEQAIGTLPEREANVIRLRYGLGGEREHTLDELGKQLGMTREGVRKIERQALRRLRHSLNVWSLREFL